MKTGLAIILIFLHLAPFWLRLSMLEIEKTMARKSAKRTILNGLPESELTYLKFSNDEIKYKLKWKHSREFEYNGIMFDIVKKKTENDSVYYWCWQDDRETFINGKIATLLKESNSSNKKNKDATKRLIHYLSSFYVVANGVKTEYNSVKESYTGFCISDNYTSRGVSPPTPPPRYC